VPKYLLLGCACVAKFVTCTGGYLDCEAAVRAFDTGYEIEVCQQEYRETGAPKTGMLLAHALSKRGDDLAAGALAHRLLSTALNADAATILGEIALSKGWLVDAAAALKHALALHKKNGLHLGTAKAYNALGELALSQHEPVEALVNLDQCIREAQQASSKWREAECRISTAAALTLIGYYPASVRELAQADTLLGGEHEGTKVDLDQAHARLAYEIGRLEASNRRELPARPGIAISDFTTSLEYALSSHMTRLVTLASLQLADLRTDGTPGSESIPDGGGELDGRINDAYETEHRQLAARIAYRRGLLPKALALNNGILGLLELPRDSDEYIAVSVRQARIALARGDLPEAERWARRGVSTVEDMRAAQSVLELRAWTLSRRREPYELLFKILVQQQRLDEALLVVDSWQARSMKDVIAQQSPDTHGTAPTIAPTQVLARWLSVESRVPPTGPRDPEQLRHALQGIDLFAIVFAEEDVWRISSEHGYIEIADLGPFNGLRHQLVNFLGPLTDLRQQLADFADSPLNEESAESLGAQLMDGRTFRETDDALYVLMDAPFSSLPIGALRHGHKPLITVRPVLRVVALPETPCVPTSTRGHVTAFADADNNLSRARAEVNEIPEAHLARLFGEDATAGKLFGISRHEVLHVATNADVGVDGGALLLHGSRVSALQIAAHKLGPSLVVLTSSSSVLSVDGDLGSLVIAFLSAGTLQVVGSLGTVSDLGAYHFARAFYRYGGIEDPIRAVAAAQTKLLRDGDLEWPRFAVFGGAVCGKASH